MKRTLITIALAALLVVPLIMTSCSCGGTTLTDSDVTAIRGYGTRIDSHDQAIATIKNTLNSMDTEVLTALAALDASELTALLDLNLDTAVTDVDTLKSDLSTLKGTTIPDLLARVTALENNSGGGSGDGTNPSGELVVELDVDEEPYTFTTGTTAATRVIPVKITNGTDGYQEIMFNVTLRCVSSADYEADVTPEPTLDVNGIALDATPVSSWAECRYIYFMWVSPDTILVAPDKVTTVYIYLGDFTTSTNEVWQASLSDIIATEL